MHEVVAANNLVPRPHSPEVMFYQTFPFQFLDFYLDRDISEQFSPCS